MIESIKPTGILSKYIKNYFIVETDNSVDYLPKERVYPSGYEQWFFIMVLHQNSRKRIQANTLNQIWLSAVNKPIIMTCHYLERQV